MYYESTGLVDRSHKISEKVNSVEVFIYPN